jgi:hypothetical protein
MSKKSPLRPYLIRLGIVILISAVAVAVFNELVYWIQKDESDRSPRKVQIVIPEGTAMLVASGIDPISIPEEMKFVVGDVLEVVNQDTVSHELGPLWVPAGSSASLVLEDAKNLAYSCSFQTSQYFGLDVRRPTTWVSRLKAMGFAVPTVTILAFIYSLLAFPVQPKDGFAKETAPAGEA